jgi:hypothetical protein
VVVTPRCADPLYRRSVRVSMGTVFQVPWTRLPEGAADRGLQGATCSGMRGIHLAALARRRRCSLDAFAAARRAVALVLGTEGDGLSRGRWPRPTPSSRSRWPGRGLAQRRLRGGGGSGPCADELNRPEGAPGRLTGLSTTVTTGGLGDDGQSVGRLAVTWSPEDW